MAYAFLLVDGVPGDSTDSNHAGWIEIITFTNSATQTLSGSTNAGGVPATGKCTFGNFTITAKASKASPLLFSKCANGDVISKITLQVCKDAGTQSVTLQYELYNVVVVSVSTPGTGLDSAFTMPTETITFAFGCIKETFTPITITVDTTSGAHTSTAGPAVVGGWDRNTNTIVSS